MKQWSISNAKDSALRFLANSRGWRSSDKLVVLDSDDWGAIRMPGINTYKELQAKGVPVGNSPYDRLDCLESSADLEVLFEVLLESRGADGQPALMTFNTVMGNPDFEAIRNDDYSKFHHEHFFDSYVRYHGTDARGIWNSAIEANVMRPQFHAREHLNTTLWLRDLRDGVGHTRPAFDSGFFGTRTGTSSANQINYLAAYWPDTQGDLRNIERILEDGLRLFEETFGYRSRCFVACNNILPSELEAVLQRYEIGLIATQRGQPVPSAENEMRLVSRRRFTGQENELGQRYAVRNVMFEPYKDPSRDWVASAMREIRDAFRMRRPAIVETHRINYVSGMDIEHRDRNLRMLRDLLAGIRQKWPDARFVGTDALERRLRGSE